MNGQLIIQSTKPHDVADISNINKWLRGYTYMLSGIREKFGHRRYPGGRREPENAELRQQIRLSKAQKELVA